MADLTRYDLEPALAALGEWAAVGAPFQLHPGDLGWHWRFGERTTAEAVTVWRDGAVIGAVGLNDSPTLLRLALDPLLALDGGFADRVVADIIAGPWTGTESPRGSAVRELLAARGWLPGEVWVPLERDLSGAVEECGLDVRIVDATGLGDRVAVQRAAFDTSTFTEDRWLAMSAGPAYSGARCLVAYDESGVPVATTTVWSAGAGRPGLIEPLGVHRDHRGRGYGRAITLAAARALRDLGSASALVATPRANAAAVATYVSAGFEAREPTRDLQRPQAGEPVDHG